MMEAATNGNWEIFMSEAAAAGTTKDRGAAQKLSAATKREMFPHRLRFNHFDRHKQGLPATAAIVSKLGMLAYVPIPKNACTSIKMFLFETIKGRPFRRNFRQIHDSFSHRAIDFDRFAADRQHFKFLVVRDPFERFVSAFNNRVLDYRELSEEFVTKKAPSELAGFKKRNLSFDPTLDEFVARCEDYIAVSLRIRHHFISQGLFFNNRPEVFDKVYNIRQLDLLCADLSERLGKQVVLPKVQESGGTDSAIRAKDVSADIKAKINAYYKEDYALLKPYL